MTLDGIGIVNIYLMICWEIIHHKLHFHQTQSYRWIGYEFKNLMNFYFNATTAFLPFSDVLFESRQNMTECKTYSTSI